MNEGKGLMIKVAMSYQRGTINKDRLEEICKENVWDYRFDKTFGVLIFPKIGKR